jgi:hypothetical protein
MASGYATRRHGAETDGLTGLTRKAGKDALAVRSLLQRYFDLEQDVIYTSHNELADESYSAATGLCLQLVAVRVLGQQMQGLLQREPVHTRLVDCRLL